MANFIGMAWQGKLYNGTDLTSPKVQLDIKFNNLNGVHAQLTQR
jgi:hypothetical protein